jgi:hypothetical protein
MAVDRKPLTGSAMWTANKRKRESRGCRIGISAGSGVQIQYSETRVFRISRAIVLWSLIALIGGRKGMSLQMTLRVRQFELPKYKFQLGQHVGFKTSEGR